MRARRWPLSVPFLFTLLPQFSAVVVGCKIWPAFAHLASVRPSEAPSFLPLSALTLHEESVAAGAAGAAAASRRSTRRRR